MVLTVLLSSVLVFAATHVLPGDVATVVLGREASEQAKNDLRKQLGLDKPLFEQYGDWLGDLVRGDWGTSLSTRHEVRSIAVERLRNSSMLALVAFLMYVPLGIILGAVAALRRNSVRPRAVRRFARLHRPAGVRHGGAVDRRLLSLARLAAVALGHPPGHPASSRRCRASSSRR